MKYFEKIAVQFVLDEKQVSSERLRKELDRNTAWPVAGAGALGALAGSILLPKKGVAANLKNIAVWGGLGTGAGALSELSKTKQIQKELQRRKDNPGYR
jgi:uncharacterized membrane protein YebE (DUF533 family)